MRRCPRKWSHSRGALGKVCDANRLKAAPSNNGGNSGSDVVSKIKVHHLSHLNMNAGFSLSTIHVSLSGTVWAAPYRTKRSNSDKFIRFNYPFICLSALGTCWLMRRKLWFSTWDAPPTSLEKTTKSFLLSLTSRSHLLRRLKVWEVQQSHQTNGTAHRLAAEIPEGRRKLKWEMEQGLINSCQLQGCWNWPDASTASSTMWRIIFCVRWSINNI